MNSLKKLSEKIGLTQTELRVNAFLFLVLIGGIIIKSIGWENNIKSNSSFNYTATDSIFYATNNSNQSIIENNLSGSDIKNLGQTTNNLKINKKKPELKEKSINLNTASFEQLTMLPGVSTKTAESILAYRKASGGFSKLDELMEVRYIGEAKFDKIKKYIYVQ
jgi:competence ComEA-like helix-hairpin-helix protein